MKPTIKVSIGGIAFQLEENAYHLLKQYLDRLQTHYDKFDGGKEIMNDIELRVAELFRDKISTPEQAVSETIVKEVIAILGQPEEIEADTAPADNSYTERITRKKLYRDTDNKVVSGVCSGLAAYFKMDVVLMRVLFVVFFIAFSSVSFSLLRFHFPFFGISGGTILLLYVILWIITPPARTVQQRYAMHGEKPDLKNIQRKVEEEIREAAYSIEKVAKNNDVIRTLAKIVGIFIGIIFVIIAVCILIAFIVVFVAGGAVVNETLGSNLLSYIDFNWSAEWFWCLLAALVLLPIIGILYGGIKLLFGIKTKVRFGLIILLLWIAALLATVWMSVTHTKSFFYWKTAHEYVELPTMNYDTLYVDIPQKYYAEGTLESISDRLGNVEITIKNKHYIKKTRNTRKKKHDQYKVTNDNKSSIYFYQKSHKSAEKLLLLPDIEKNYSVTDNNFGIDIYKDAAGNSRQNAIRHARDIPFNYTLKDSLLTINPLVYTQERKWDGEWMRVRFRVPKGKVVVFEGVIGK